VIEFGEGLAATIVEDLGRGLKRLRFESVTDVESSLFALGTMPLPPYVHNALQDEERYQTVYASTPGSAAAPTAGLHFTEQVLSELAERGVLSTKVSLDVGLDTFRPVNVDEIEDHQIHGERCELSEETADAIARCRGRIVAVGTTSVRTLETFATGTRQVGPGTQVSRLLITPGYKFRIIDGMFTNFHLPRTSMLFMVAALAGRERLMSAYDEAVRTKCRFLSFGDSMLVL
jgi:S-adenosylmethionine:tRNA ribosyltransferase-isomerase